DQQSVKRWSNHFTTLAKDEAVRKIFRAILEFDIETRQNYALRPHQHNEDEWSHRLQKKKYATLQEEVHRQTEHLLRSSLPDRATAAHSRYEPYDREAHHDAMLGNSKNLILWSFATPVTTLVAANPPSLSTPCASSVDISDIVSQCALKRYRQKVHKHLRNIPPAISADVPMAPRSASPSISTILAAPANEIMQINTSVPFADGQNMVPCCASVSDPSDDDFFLAWTNDLSSSSSTISTRS
ncbi:hypothetical protein AZE42_13741, partial [Rhizopogon vesiculosus]